MITAGKAYLYRQFCIKIPHGFLRRRLEKVELQAPAQTGLVDVNQQRVHLRLVRKLFQKGPERAVDFPQLLAVQVKIDGLSLFLDVVLLEALFLRAPAIERFQLALPMTEECADHYGDEQTKQSQCLGQRRPRPRVLGIQVPELIEEIFHGWFPLTLLGRSRGAAFGGRSRGVIDLLAFEAQVHVELGDPLVADDDRLDFD